MDHQQALLCKIVHDSDIVTAVNARITPDFFTDDKWRRVYEYLLDHWRRFSTPPDLAVVGAAFPSYDWPVFGQSIDYFIDGLRQRRKKVILTDALNQAATFYQTPDEPAAIDMVEQTLHTALLEVRMQTAPTYDVNFFDEIDNILDRLDERERDPGYLRGISTGFRGIDYVTGGFQPGQLVVIIGLPKSMKSSTLLYMATRVRAQAKVPLFLGFEMSNEEQQDRLVSLYSEVGLTKVMNGEFNTRERREIERALRMMAQSPIDFITSVDMESALTVPGIQAKIVEYHPDVVLIDGAYLMQSELPKAEPGSAQALANIARELKKLAQAQRIPIIVTTQATETRAKGGKLTAASAMYTQAWRQSADVMIGTEREDMEGDDSGEVIIKTKVLASRAGPRAESVIAWDWSKGTVAEMDASYFKPESDA
jgi:replicative DNA helicase